MQEQIESKSINSREFKEEFYFHRLQKIKQDVDWRSRSDIKKDIRFKRAIRDPLDIGEIVYVLVERLRKKTHLEDFTEVWQKINLFSTRVNCSS